MPRVYLTLFLVGYINFNAGGQLCHNVTCNYRTLCLGSWNEDTDIEFHEKNGEEIKMVLIVVQKHFSSDPKTS